MISDAELEELELMRFSGLKQLLAISRSVEIFAEQPIYNEEFWFRGGAAVTSAFVDFTCERAAFFNIEYSNLFVCLRKHLYFSSFSYSRILFFQTIFVHSSFTLYEIIFL